MSEVTSGKATALVLRCIDLSNVLPGCSPRGGSASMCESRPARYPLGSV